MAIDVYGWYSSFNTYLYQPERDYNSINVWSYFTDAMHGWNVNAIAGMCGCMDVESSINPLLFEGRPAVFPGSPNSWKKGIGLTQWTSSKAPPQKLVQWATDRGWAWASGWIQCYRIHREALNNYQWVSKNVQGITFTQFAWALSEEPERMAEIFTRAYERPAHPDMETRRELARYYYDLWLSSTPIPIPEDPEPVGPLPPDPDPPDPHGELKMWYIPALMKRRKEAGLIVFK